MPFPDLSGWGGPQQTDFSAQPPQYVLDAMGGSFDSSKYYWNPDNMSLVDRTTGASYGFNNPDPANGTQVVLPYGYQGGDLGYGGGGTNIGQTMPGFGDTLQFGEGQNPYLAFPDGGSGIFASSDPNAIDAYQHDAQTRALQGVGQVGALVGGAALGGALSGGNSSLTTGNVGNATVSGSNAFYGGGQDLGALISSGMGPQAALGGAGAGVAAGGSFLQNWLPTIVGGANALYGANQAGKAADAEAAGYQSGINEIGRQYDTTRADNMPWMDFGRQSLTNLSNPAENYLASPGYEHLRTEGQRDIGNSFSARGGAQSGNALRALAEFQTGLAQQDYGNWYNRQLSGAGLGQSSVNTVTAAGSNAANNTANYLGGQGVSRASGIRDRSAILGQGLQDGVSNWLYRRRA